MMNPKLEFGLAVLRRLKEKRESCLLLARGFDLENDDSKSAALVRDWLAAIDKDIVEAALEIAEAKNESET